MAATVSVLCGSGGPASAEKHNHAFCVVVEGLHQLKNTIMHPVVLDSRAVATPGVIVNSQIV